MKYKSTRDGSSKEYTFEEALFSGYAPDGGLFVPESLPSIAAEDLVNWSTLSYPELVFVVLVSSILVCDKVYILYMFHILLHLLNFISCLCFVAYVYIIIRS